MELNNLTATLDHPKVLLSAAEMQSQDATLVNSGDESGNRDSLEPLENGNSLLRGEQERNSAGRSTRSFLGSSTGKKG